MAVLKSLDTGYHKDFSTLQPSTKLPSSPFHRFTPQTPSHDNSSKGHSLPRSKRPSAEILFNMKPFFRHAVTVQLLGDKTSTGQQCFKLVRDLDGEFISTQDSKNLNRRYEQTVSWNRINLTRRVFPDIGENRGGLLRHETNANPFKNVHDKTALHRFYDASPLFTHMRNFSISNKDYGTSDNFSSSYYKERGHQTGISLNRQIPTIQNPKTLDNQFAKSRLEDVRFLDCEDETSSTPIGRSLESPFFTRDHGTSCSRVLFSRGHTNSSMSPDSLCPEVIKIVPQRKDPTVRIHETRKEKKRRLGSHHVFAPPPSPVISSKYSSYSSETGAFVRPKNVPFKD